jgi:hypothetical protein
VGCRQQCRVLGDRRVDEAAERRGPEHEVPVPTPDAPPPRPRRPADPARDQVARLRREVADMRRRAEVS